MLTEKSEAPVVSSTTRLTPFRGLCDANSRQARVSDFNGLAEHAGSQRSIVKIEVDSFRDHSGGGPRIALRPAYR